MLHVTIGCLTLRVAIPELEAQLNTLEARVIRMDGTVTRTEQKIDRLLAQVEGTPRVDFRIGPITDQ
jgi:hypothetical protein